MALSITTTYAGEFAGKYIAAALLSAPTIENGGVTVIPNVKYKHVIQKFATDSIVKDATCDFDASGKTMSHFEMYLQAMQSMGANTQEMGRFIELISNQVTIEEALDACVINPETNAFVRFTFSIIQRGKIHEIASVFTFGREDLIPEMFIEMVKELKANHQSALDDFLFYLERHIEVDGEDHGPLSLKLMDEVCEGDPAKWEEATQVAEEALRMRIHLWDGVVRKASTLLHGI